MIDIKEVKSKKELLKFIKFPFLIYKKSPFWIPPIIREERYMFDRKKNPSFRDATVHFFLAYKNGKIVGRIAAIINWLEVKECNKKKVRFGWLDMIDDIEVSRVLLKKVEEIGKKHKMEFIEGPMGFSSFDKSGMLTEGFEEMGAMHTYYNYSYYPQHLYKLGFNPFNKWLEFELKIPTLESELSKKIERISSVVLKKNNLKLVNLKNTKELVSYGDKIFQLIDETYNILEEYTPFKPYHVEYYKKKFLKYLNPNFVKLITNENDKLIAFSVTGLSFSKAIKKMNGYLFPFGIFHLLKAQFFNKRLSSYLIGVYPDYQRKGVPAILIYEMMKLSWKKGLEIMEVSPEAETNKAAQNLWIKQNDLDIHISKKRATFSKKIAI